MTASLASSETAAAKLPACAREPARPVGAQTDIEIQDALRSVSRGRSFLRQRRSVMFEAHPKSEIEALLKSDSEFRQLYQRHKELDKQVLDAELGVLAVDDATLARMKKEKLFAKDKLTRIYDQHAAVH
jgi:uncharacterized protein YdcH (DUF465 family)